MTTPTLTIWRLKDGNMGHEKQTQALIEGFQLRHSLIIEEFTIQHHSAYYIAQWLLQRPILPSQQQPDIIIGAGHKTHIPVLVAKQQQGGKAVVVMKPSLPHQWFDAIIAPQHDYPQGNHPSHIITTLTALAPTIDSQPQQQQGLILLGGVSKHFSWDNQKIINAVDNIVTLATTAMEWHVSTSRRTPSHMLAMLKKRFDNNPNVNIIGIDQIDQHWLPNQLVTAGTIWITNDSASMLAEALNTRAHVGIIALDSKSADNKLDTASRLLIQQGIVSIDGKITAAEPTRSPLNEHIRCSQKITDLILTS